MKRTTTTLFYLFLAVVLVLSACTPAATPAVTEAAATEAPLPERLRQQQKLQPKPRLKHPHRAVKQKSAAPMS